MKLGSLIFNIFCDLYFSGIKTTFYTFDPNLIIAEWLLIKSAVIKSR